MKTTGNGLLLVQAAEDFGGFERVQTAGDMIQSHLEKQLYCNQIEARYTTYLRGTGVGRGGAISAGTTASGLPMSPNAAGVSLDQPPAILDIAQRQKKIQDEIKLMRGTPPKMSYDVAWQRLRTTRSELFQGLEPVVIHPD